jgi:hypothetical protein
MAGRPPCAALAVVLGRGQASGKGGGIRLFRYARYYQSGGGPPYRRRPGAGERERTNGQDVAEGELFAAASWWRPVWSLACRRGAVVAGPRFVN